MLSNKSESYPSFTILLKSFSESTTEDMRTYIKPPLKRDPNRVIIHVGTNDLRSSQAPKSIAKNTIDIAKNSKNDKNEIVIPCIKPRRHNLNGISCQVNKFLEKI